MPGILSDLRRGRYLVITAIAAYVLVFIGVFGGLTWQTGIVQINPSAIANFFINGLSGIFNTFRNLVEKTLVNGVGSFISGLISGLKSVITGFFTAIGNVASAPFRIFSTFFNGIGSIGETIYNGVMHILTSIFHGSISFGVGHVSYVAILIIVVTLVWIGYFVMQFNDQILSYVSLGIGSSGVTSIGEIFIMLGATVAIYGTDPQNARLILGGAFFLILIAGILSAVKGLRG